VGNHSLRPRKRGSWSLSLSGGLRSVHCVPGSAKPLEIQSRSRDSVDVEFHQADLADPESCRKICRGADVVMHLAAKIRGVGYNVKHHGEMFFSNAVMNLHMMEAARLEGVDRFLISATIGGQASSTQCLDSSSCAAWKNSLSDADTSPTVTTRN
jgi:nucleoside-diphosphate-sugar epimerase